MLVLKAEPENMEVMGYVRSSTVANTEFMLCEGIEKEGGMAHQTGIGKKSKR